MLTDKRVQTAANPAVTIVVAIVLVSATSCGQHPLSNASQSVSKESKNSQSSLNSESQTLNSSSDQAAKESERQDQAYAEARRRMVAEQLADRDIFDPLVLKAMARVQRHRFVPPSMQAAAYADSPLPIGHGQTISQPYIVALMTQLVEAQPHKKALDIGTGSGYQAAVLAEIVKSVHSIEIIEPLADEARARLLSLGYQNITVRAGDGYRGWDSEAPFDIITVAAAAGHVPQPLINQLAPGGKLVIPVGERFQTLLLISKNKDGTVDSREIVPVAFVPMTGEAQNSRSRPD